MVWGVLAGAGVGADKSMTSMENRALSKTNRTIAEAEESRKAQMFEAQVALAESMKMRALVDDPQGWQAQFSPQAQGAALPADGMGPPAAAPIPDRRTRYNQYYDKAAQLAAMTGGLEGFYKFQEMEDATSRRQVLGYALQAVNAMDEGNVGEAMRAGNAALEVTPFDTGLKFEARDGNLYLVGANGKAGQPLDANQLRAFTEDNLKTPENYLNFKAQYETERAAQVGEKQRGRALDVQEGYLDIAEEKLPAELSKTGAEIYNLIQTADARMANASNTPGLTPTILQRINNDIPTLIDNAKINPGSDWWSVLAQNPGIGNAMQSGAIDIAALNLLEAGNYADAVGLAAFAYAPAADVEVPSGVRVEEHGVENGRPYAVWNGKKLWIPQPVYNALDIQLQALESGQ